VLWGVHGHYDNNGQTVGGQLVGLLYVISAQVHSKTPTGGVACPFDSVRAVFVGVSKPGAPSVCFDNLPECMRVYVFTVSG
jgi:hypothetical protein